MGRTKKQRARGRPKDGIRTLHPKSGKNRNHYKAQCSACGKPVRPYAGVSEPALGGWIVFHMKCQPPEPKHYPKVAPQPKVDHAAAFYGQPLSDLDA